MNRNLTPDQTLIDRLSIDDTDAFEELYRLYWPSLYLYCLKKIESPQDAKIIVRTIFIDIWEKRQSLPVSFCLSKYLYLEVRKSVVKCLTQKLSDSKDRISIEKRLIAEFSVQSLQAARKPVTNRYTVINKQSELIRQQTGQSGTEHYNTMATVRYLLQAFTDKITFTNLLSYTKN